MHILVFSPFQYTFASMGWMADDGDVVSGDWDPGLPMSRRRFRYFVAWLRGVEYDEWKVSRKPS